MINQMVIRMERAKFIRIYRIIQFGFFCLNSVLAYLILSDEFDGEKIGFNFFTFCVLIGGLVLVGVEVRVFVEIIDLLKHPLAPFWRYQVIEGKYSPYDDPNGFELAVNKYNERLVGRFAHLEKIEYNLSPEVYRLIQEKKLERKEKRQIENDQSMNIVRGFGFAYLVIFIMVIILTSLIVIFS